MAGAAEVGPGKHLDMVVDIQETWDETGESGQAVVKRYPMPQADGAQPDAAGPGEQYDAEGSDDSGSGDDLKDFDAVLEEMEALEWDESLGTPGTSGQPDTRQPDGAAKHQEAPSGGDKGTQGKVKGLRRGFLLPKPAVPLKPALKSQSTVGDAKERAVQETSTASPSRPSTSSSSLAFSGTVRERSAKEPEGCRADAPASASRHAPNGRATEASPALEPQAPPRISRFKQAMAMR
ncbi:hypothetical protein ACKKBG_A29290 [Auxenochlorella protothecoides x Auxenochlorella symbiontica]